MLSSTFSKPLLSKPPGCNSISPNLFPIVWPNPQDTAPTLPTIFFGSVNIFPYASSTFACFTLFPFPTLFTSSQKIVLFSPKFITSPLPHPWLPLSLPPLCFNLALFYLSEVCPRLLRRNSWWSLSLFRKYTSKLFVSPFTSPPFTLSHALLTANKRSAHYNLASLKSFHSPPMSFFSTLVRQPLIPSQSLSLNSSLKLLIINLYLTTLYTTFTTTLYNFQCWNHWTVIRVYG